MNLEILLLHPDRVHVIGSNLRVLLLPGHPGLTRLHGLHLGAKVEYPGYRKNTSKTSPVWAMVGIDIVFWQHMCYIYLMNLTLERRVE